MNLSTLCPTYDVGYGPERWENWIIRNIVDTDSKDGLILDRITERESWLIDEYARNIDPDCSNTLPDDDYKNFDLAWEQSVEQLLQKLREMFGDKPLIANSSGSYAEFLNGSIYESSPGNWSNSIPETYKDWTKDLLGVEGYINISKNAYFPNFSLIETYEIDEYSEINPMENTSFVPNYQRMRFGITTALLGNGYFSYEISTNGHGSLGLMWFDEYDNAGEGRGYLGYPISDAFILFDFGTDGKVFRRDFEKGIVICNPSEREVITDLNDSYKLIEGVQVPSVNTGEWVTSILVASKDGRILLNK
jgi:hypothetical protein